VPFWAKDIKVGFANINAKAEGIENKPAFRETFQRRRCIVPVDNFHEWKSTATGKQPYAITFFIHTGGFPYFNNGQNMFYATYGEQTF
jgi:putative SOS response-associated peptidase YedK